MSVPRSRLARAAAVASVLIAGVLNPVLANASDETEPKEGAMQVEYLEIVSPDAEATCASFAKIHGVEFGDPIAELGGARVAELANGGRIAVRAPMHDQEGTVWRPYFLTNDIEAAVKAAEAAGAEIAHPPLEIPGQGTFAIYFLGGNQYGLWQN